MDIRGANGNIILSETYDGDHPERYFVVADSSYRFREIMGDNTVVLNFSLTYFVDFPIGCRILYENETYTMLEIPNVTKANERQYDYTLTFYNPAKQLSRYKFRNMVDGRLNFTLTAQPQKFIDHICDNLNARNTGEVWTRGDYIESAEKTQTFSHNTILDALSSIAQLFETEWEIKQTANGYSISIKKVEYNKATAEYNNAQRLSYGKGNGFVSGITRQKSDENAVDCVWVEGGDRNINSQTYTYQKTIVGQVQTLHANKLRLPIDKTVYYLPPTSDTDKGVVYTIDDVISMAQAQGMTYPDYVNMYLPTALVFLTDDDGFGLHRRTQDYINNGFEDSLELAEIYPHLKLQVTEAILEGYNDGKPDSPDPEIYSNRFWDITAVDNPVDYNDYMIGGETATIIFNSGMLAGKEFNLANQGSEQNPSIYNPTEQLFLIQPTEIDGITMPDLPIDIQDKDGKDGTGYIPAVGDEFAVFHVALPQEYIDKAERELLLEACYYLYKHGEVEVEFNGTVDGIWSRNKWETLRQYFVLGGYVKFYDSDLCRDGRLLRILSIKDYLTRPHAPELMLSNSTVAASVSSEIKKIAQNQVFQTQNYANAVQFSKRGFRASEQAQIKIAEAYATQLENVSDEISQQLNITNTYFTESINPVTIQTMSLLIGDKNLQFVFGHADTDSIDNKVEAWNRYTYEPQWTGSALVCPATVNVAGGSLAAHVRHDYWTKTQDGITADEVGNHPYWIVNSAVLRSDGNGQPLDSAKAYFLYLQAPKAAASADGFGYLTHAANFYLYEQTHAHTEDDFFLLVGILNAEFGGDRAYVDMYSSVDINGGQIHADYLGDHDSNFYIDLVNKLIKGNINIIDGALTKELILGATTTANLGGMTGRDVYYGENVESFYNRKVRFWIGENSSLTESSGKTWLSGATIIFFSDGSFLFKLQGKNFYRDVNRTWSLYADGNMRVSEDIDCKKIWASEYLEIGEDDEDTTYFYGTFSHIVGGIEGVKKLKYVNLQSVNGLVPTLIWSGRIWLRNANRNITWNSSWTFSGVTFQGNVPYDTFYKADVENESLSLSVGTPQDNVVLIGVGGWYNAFALSGGFVVCQSRYSAYCRYWHYADVNRPTYQNENYSRWTFAVETADNSDFDLQIFIIKDAS